MQTIPYFYVIKHVPTNKLYAGIRTARGCHPNELMTANGYKTSSNVVKRLIDQEGLEAFKVIYTITQDELGIHVAEFERHFLKIHDAAKSDKWLNLANCVLDVVSASSPKVRDIARKTRRANVLKKGKKFIVVDTIENVCYKGHELYIKEVLGITNIGQAVKNRRKLFDRYEIYPETETFEEHMTIAIPMREDAFRRAQEGRKNALASKMQNRDSRLDVYVLVDIYTDERIEGTLFDLHKIGHPVYKMKDMDRPTNRGRHVLIKKGLDLDKELERMKMNFEEFKRELFVKRSKARTGRVYKESTRNKISESNKGKPKKNSKLYEVYKDGVFVRGPELLPNHAEYLGLKYVTIHCAAKEGRPTKNGYFFKPVE